MRYQQPRAWARPPRPPHPQQNHIRPPPGLYPPHIHANPDYLSQIHANPELYPYHGMRVPDGVDVNSSPPKQTQPLPTNSRRFVPNPRASSFPDPSKRPSTYSEVCSGQRVPSKRVSTLAGARPDPSGSLDPITSNGSNSTPSSRVPNDLGTNIANGFERADGMKGTNGANRAKRAKHAKRHVDTRELYDSEDASSTWPVDGVWPSRYACSANRTKPANDSGVINDDEWPNDGVWPAESTWSANGTLPATEKQPADEKKEINNTDGSNELPQVAESPKSQSLSRKSSIVCGHSSVLTTE